MIVIDPYRFAAPAGGGGGGAGYRYYRLVITANNNDTYVGTHSLELRESVGGADVAPGSGGAASALDTYNTNYLPEYAFDGSPSSMWFARLTNPIWLQFDFGAGNEKEIVEYAVGACLTTGTSFDDRSPRDWTLEGSNDGSAWDVLHTVTGETGWSSTSELRVFTI